MRLDIYISTEVSSVRKRNGTYHAMWIGYSNSGKRVGEDGITDSGYENQYGMLVLALKAAAEHINQNARPEVRICCKYGPMVRAIKSLKTWEKQDFKRKNGQKLSHEKDWRFISKKLNGLFYCVHKGVKNGK